MYAIIETGAKQYRVSKGDKLRVEKLEGAAGDVVAFDALLVSDGKSVKVGSPIVKGVTVSAKILRDGKDKKVVVFKYKPKIGYRKKQGHRQPFTEIEILAIGDPVSGAKATAAKPAEKPAASAAKSAAPKADASAKAAKAKPAATTAKSAAAAKPAAKTTAAKKTTSTAAKTASTAKKTTSSATAKKTTSAASKTTTAKKTTSSATKTAAKKPAEKKTEDK